MWLPNGLLLQLESDRCTQCSTGGQTASPSLCCAPRAPGLLLAATEAVRMQQQMGREQKQCAVGLLLGSELIAGNLVDCHMPESLEAPVASHACRHAHMPGTARRQSLLTQGRSGPARPHKQVWHAAQPLTCSKVKKHWAVWHPEGLQCACRSWLCLDAQPSAADTAPRWLRASPAAVQV